MNLWYAAYLGLDGPGGDRGRLTRELDQLQALGVTNVRVLAASEPTAYAPLTPVFQPAPGKYNEDLLCGLDYALDQIGRRGIKAVLYLNNQWEWSGGMSTYVNWVTGEPRPASNLWPDTLRYDVRFYSLSRARALYLSYLRMLTTRINQANGRRYTDDSTIMAWQLANEPRAGAEGELNAVGDALLSWVTEASQLLRSLAAHQLICTGSEGLVGSGNDRNFYQKIHALGTIDYLTAHIWPFDWGWYRPADSTTTLPIAIHRTCAYLATHVAVARAAGKPLVLEEFGLPRDHGRFAPDTTTTARNTYFRAVFNYVRDGLEAQSPLVGLNLWAWSGEGVPVNSDGAHWRVGTPLCGDNGVENQGLNSLYSTDHSTLSLLQEFNRDLARHAADPLLSRL